MSLGFLVALALPFLGPPPVTHSEKIADGAWTLILSRNRFTGATTCMLKGRRMEVRGPALVLQFPKSVDTSDAWIRIGAEDAWPWRRLIPDLHQMGVRLREDDLENPSQGRVAIPIRLLVDATTLVVAPSERSQTRRFTVSGLSDALERANGRGCAFPTITNPPLSDPSNAPPK